MTKNEKAEWWKFLGEKIAEAFARLEPSFGSRDIAWAIDTMSAGPHDVGETMLPTIRRGPGGELGILVIVGAPERLGAILDPYVRASAAKDLARRILNTPTEGEDLTKAYFPLSEDE